MSDIDFTTLLACLAGVNIFFAIVTLLYSLEEPVYPGFRLWASGGAALALVYLLLALREYLPTFLPFVIGPGLVVLAAVFRLGGLRRFLGRRRFDYPVLALPVIAVGVAAYCTYGSLDAPIGALVVAVELTLVFWLMAGLCIYHARGRDRSLNLMTASVCGLYGAFVLSAGIFWLVESQESLLFNPRTGNIALYMLFMFFDIIWVVQLMGWNSRRTARDLAMAQDLAEEGRRQLSDIIAFLPDAIFAMDVDRRVIAWNRAAEELTGVPADQVVGKAYEETAYKALGDGDGVLLELVLDSTGAIPERYRNPRREGDWLSAESEAVFPGREGRRFDLWLTAAPLRDSSGAVAGAIESIRDVSERARAERALRESEQRFRSLFEVNMDGILVIGADGSIQDANPAACAMLGMTKEEICAAGHEGIIQRGDDVEKRLQARQLRGEGKDEFTFVRKDGTTFPTECWALDWRDSLGVNRGFVVFHDITERIEVQKVLRQSEARLLQAQAVSHVGNWEIDLVAQSVWLSPETLRIHGDDVSAQYFPFDMQAFTNSAEDPEVLASALKQAMTAPLVDMEYRIIRRNDGTPRTVRAIARTEFDDSGKPVKISGVVQDITELRQVEEALRLTQYTVDHVGDRVFWVGPDGRFVYASDSTCQQLGYTREELMDLAIFDVDPTIEPADWDRAWLDLKRLGSMTLPGLHRAKDGTEVPVEVSAHYIVHDGQEYHFVFAREAADRPGIEESLRLIQYSVDHAGDPVFWISPEGRFLEVSDSTCRQLGYSREELLKMTIYDVDPTLSRDWRQSWATVKQQGSDVHEAVLRAKDGTEVPVEMRSDYIEHNGQEYKLVFARDISERRRVEEDAGEADERIRQLQTMEAIGQLAGGIAHDFNNLLTAIIGYGNLILASEDVQDLSIRKDAEEIRAAAERASALTRQILAFARRQALRPQVLSLTELVVSMEPQIGELVGEDIDVVGVEPSDPSFVDVDRSQFEQALLGLVTNARDAMPDGGRLTLDVRNVDLDEEYCRVYPDSQPGSYVMVSVSDNGEGMSTATMSHVFEPFFTTKAPGAGTGLGLSMVYGFVRQSGGFVNVYSDVGEGTTVKVYLPRVQSPSGVAEAESVAPSSVRGDETVLVVEDEEPLRRLIARVLGNLGYHVVVAGSGPEALELLEVMESPPDLLLTDVILPGGMQGNQLAKQTEEVVPGVSVLYMSGHTRDAIVHSGRLDEGVDFLGKPFTPEALAARVREVLSRRT